MQRSKRTTIYRTKWRPAPNTSQDGFVHDNGRRLLANRYTCTFIGLLFSPLERLFQQLFHLKGLCSPFEGLFSPFEVARILFERIIAKYCFKIWVLGINVLSASLLATLGTFTRCKDGKAKTATAVDAGNFAPCRFAKDKMLSFNKLLFFV